MKDWMSSLASHYEALRDRYPRDRLMIVFDIDGTILDMRYTILHALKCFDKNHGTQYFEGTRIADIDFHEDHLPDLLERLSLPTEDRNFVEEEYKRLLFSSASVLEAHRPFRGVLEVIRWFQLQPNTFVGLNTGRPESMRFSTLRALNQLGKEYRVAFGDDLLFMNDDMDRPITQTKILGIEHFKNHAFRVVAVVDNEPENLEAISKCDTEGEILLLHADTIFKSREDAMPGHALKGRSYDCTKLISKESIPKHTQFVWHCDNTWANLNSFLRSNIHWIEIDLRGFFLYMQKPADRDQFALDDCLTLIKQRKKGIKLDLYGGGLLIGKVVEMIQKHDIDTSSLWFQASSLVLGESGFQLLRLLFPSATLQCPVDIFAPVVDEDPEMVKEKLVMLQGWGINRFGVSWSNPQRRRLLSYLCQWGFEADLHNVSSLGSFLRAALLLPHSITTRFNCSAAWSQREDRSERAAFPPDDSMFRRIA